MIVAISTDVRKYYPVRRGYLRRESGVVRAVDGVSIEIRKGEVYGLVGESGSGKTTLGKIFLGLIEPDHGRSEVRTDRVQAVFQDPYGSLDPKMLIGDVLSEALILRKETKGMKARCAEALDRVQLSRSALNKFPHQFSGGERQRVAIARAIVADPEFIVCDEPVSSLDVIIQLQILDMLKDIQKSLCAAILFISHDLRVIRYMCDRVAVMKEGKIVEDGPVAKVYKSPSHPHTKLLLSSALEVSPRI